MRKKILMSIILILPIFAFGQTDLQKLIDNASKIGHLKLALEKTYVVSKPLKLPSGFTLDGNNSTIVPEVNWRLKNERYSALFDIVGVKNVNISNLKIDNMARRGTDGMPSYSMLITNSSFVEISNVTFKDLGVHISKKEVGGSPFILIVAQEASGDFSYLPKKYTNVLGSVSNVEIKNSTFSNSDFVNSFAIRMLTLWTKGRKKDNIRNKVTNILLQNNVFKGEYDWNTIEMAGPATRYVSVISNNIIGKSSTNIDVDKGASDIIIDKNVITKAGLPNRHKSDPNVRVSPIMVHGSSSSYLCENVVVSNNTIDGIENPESNNSRYLYSSGIGVWYAKNVKILDNQIKNAFVNKDYGTAICLDKSIQGIDVERNVVNNVKWGIVITPNTNSFSNINISDNDIVSRSEPMLLLNGAKGSFKRLILKGNRIESKSGKKVKIGRKILAIDSDIK